MKEQEFELLLRSALRPDVETASLAVHGCPKRKGYRIPMKKIITRACAIAAIVALLATTVYAADALNIKTLLSGSRGKLYKTVELAEEKAGFEIDAKDSFSNGYSFAGARVQEVKGLDKDDRVRLTYNEITQELHNPSGERLLLTAYQYQESIPASNLPPQQTKKWGDTLVQYRVDHYKFVPPDYTQTEADKLWVQQPGNFLSYGSDTVQEEDVAFLIWEKDGICYHIMDHDADEGADSLFSMAEELILSGK